METQRWVSIAFTVIVIFDFIIIFVQEAPPEWLFYLPPPPLFILLFMGLYLFVLPYVTKWRGGRRKNDTNG